MNNKLNEFIIKYSDFWDLLSDTIKAVIYDLDSYGNLEPLFKYDYCVAGSENCTSGWKSINECYLYIGERNNWKYYYKCTYEVCKEYYNFKLENGQLVTVGDLTAADKNKKIKYSYNNC